MKEQKANRPFLLSGACNVRELGGYVNMDGQTTKTHAFLRADGLFRLTMQDQKKLYDYGVRCVVDLRSERETELYPCSLIGYENIEYMGIELFDHVQSNQLRGGFPPSLSAMYKELLDQSQPGMLRVFQTFARHEADCVVFNCTAGKDRTGVVAMLLLKLAGVSDAMVTVDYAASANNLRELFVAQREGMAREGYPTPDYLFASDAEQMQQTLDYLQAQYGGSEAYLRAIGLTETQIQRVKDKLI